MNKNLFTLLFACTTLVVLPGCWFKKSAKKVEVTKKENAKEVIE